LFSLKEDVARQVVSEAKANAFVVLDLVFDPDVLFVPLQNKPGPDARGTRMQHRVCSEDHEHTTRETPLRVHK
jgi:hypothetical protein